MAANRKMAEWLFGELPALVDRGVLQPEAAEGLRRYYEEEGAKEPRRSVALAACGILGAALIGLGVILLVAHNWDGMTRPQRALVSYLPLLAGIGLTAWTILRRPDSVAWREGSTVFLMAAVGACIALVSQTYHIMSDMAGFLLVWMALTGPLAYLAKGNLVAVFYWAGLLFYAGYSHSRYTADALWYWPLAAAMLPRLWMVHKKAPGNAWELLMSWVLAVSLCIAPALLLSGTWGEEWRLVYPGIFAVMYVASRWQNRESGFWSEPFRVVSTAGISITALIFTMRHSWDNSSWRFNAYSDAHWLLAVQDNVLAFGLLGLALALVALNVVKRRFDLIPFGILPLLALIGFALSANRGVPGQAIGVAFNFYLLALALWVMIYGIRKQRLSRLNGGLALLSLLIFVRFVDSDLPIVARAVAFILLGAGFLTANAVMLYRKGVKK